MNVAFGRPPADQGPRRRSGTGIGGRILTADTLARHDDRIDPDRADSGPCLFGPRLGAGPRRRLVPRAGARRRHASGRLRRGDRRPPAGHGAAALCAGRDQHGRLPQLRAAAPGSRAGSRGRLPQYLGASRHTRPGGRARSSRSTRSRAGASRRWSMLCFPSWSTLPTATTGDCWNSGVRRRPRPVPRHSSANSGPVSGGRTRAPDWPRSTVRPRWSTVPATICWTRSEHLPFSPCHNLRIRSSPGYSLRPRGVEMTELNQMQADLCEESQTDYSDLRALFINCTLKRSPEVSNTQGLADLVDSDHAAQRGHRRERSAPSTTRSPPASTRHDRARLGARRVAGDLRAGDGRRHPRARSPRSGWGRSPRSARR